MIYRLKPQQGDTVAVPQLVFARLGAAEEASVPDGCGAAATSDFARALPARDGGNAQRSEHNPPFTAKAMWPSVKRLAAAFV